MVFDSGQELLRQLEGGGDSWNNLPLSCFPVLQVILAGGEVKRRSWKDHCIKYPLCLSDTELVTNPQEGCCYCLGVGEAC